MPIDKSFTRILDSVLDVVVPENPLNSARRALSYLTVTNAAHCAAVFIPSPDEGRVDLFVSTSIDQKTVDRTQQAWSRDRGSFERGEWTVHEQTPEARPYVVAPLLQDQLLVALLYLDSEEPRFVRSLDRQSVEYLGRVIAASVRVPALSVRADFRSHLLRKTTREVRRAELLNRLGAHEWNVARVARDLSVSRVTIYAWMRELAIERQHVRKTKQLAQ